MGKITKAIHEAKFYLNIHQFKAHAPEHYILLEKSNFLDDATAHMSHDKLPYGYFTIDLSFEIAKLHKHRNDFKKHARTAYEILRKSKVLDQACEHMNEFRTRVPHGTWTLERVHKAALMYEHPSHFKKSNSGAYQAARKNGWLKYVTSHMTRLGNLYKRGLYVFEFRGEDGKKYAYIGLTGNYEKRYRQHMYNSKHIIKKTKEMGHEFIMFNVFYPAEEAAKQEELLIKSYHKKGWKILNKVKGGALGGKFVIWTPETLKEEALKFKTRSKFQKKSRGAYSAAKKLGIFEEVCAHMPKDVKKIKIWTPEKIQKEALKFSRRTDFQRKSPGAYGAAKELGKDFLEKVYAHMNTPTKSLTNEELHEIALKYKRRIDFLKNERNYYSAAQRRKILQSICSHMKPCYPKLTDEQIHEKALNHKSRSDFQKNDGRAYNHARKRGILDKVCEHMIPPYQHLTDEEVKKKALKYNRKIDFLNKDPKAYDTARRRGILDAVCVHMSDGLKKWTEKDIRVEAKNYYRRIDFQRKSRGAYAAAKRLGIFDEVCAHMPKLSKRKK